MPQAVREEEETRSSSSHPADVDKYYLPPSGVQRGCGVQGLWRAFGPGQSVYSRTRDQARRLLIYLATVIDDSAAGALAACRPAARAPLIRVPSSHTCVRGSLESHACPTEESAPSAVCRRSGSAAAASSATSTASAVASASTAAFPDHRRRRRRRRRRIAATATAAITTATAVATAVVAAATAVAAVAAAIAAAVRRRRHRGRRRRTTTTTRGARHTPAAAH